MERGPTFSFSPSLSGTLKAPSHAPGGESPREREPRSAACGRSGQRCGHRASPAASPFRRPQRRASKSDRRGAHYGAEPTAHARADRGAEPTARARAERGAHLRRWAGWRPGALRSGSLHSRSRDRGTAARHPARGDVVHGKHRPHSGPVQRGLPKATASRLVPALVGPGWADALAI